MLTAASDVAWTTIGRQPKRRQSTRDHLSDINQLPRDNVVAAEKMARLFARF